MSDQLLPVIEEERRGRGTRTDISERKRLSLLLIPSVLQSQMGCLSRLQKACPKWNTGIVACRQAAFESNEGGTNHWHVVMSPKWQNRQVWCAVPFSLGTQLCTPQRSKAFTTDCGYFQSSSQGTWDNNGCIQLSEHAQTSCATCRGKSVQHLASETQQPWRAAGNKPVSPSPITWTVCPFRTSSLALVFLSSPQWLQMKRKAKNRAKRWTWRTADSTFAQHSALTWQDTGAYKERGPRTTWCKQ